ncbi:MAG: DUF2283 domain-containing protein [Chloroflexi bacterium]|nr:DUF2283 domain-containing protein [Chloroflexota bacterium]
MNLPLERIAINPKEIAQFRIVYDRKYDTLFVRPEPPRPAIAVDVAGEIWLRVDPETMQVVGLEIEDFATVFLKRHPDLAHFWREVQPSRLPWRRKGEMATFALVLGEFVRRAFRSQLQQAHSPFT